MKLSFPPLLETDRLNLCRLRYEDAEEIFYTYASKPEATRYLSWPTHHSIADTVRFLHYAVGAWRAGIDYGYAIRHREHNRLIGGCGMINDNGRIQFGYVLGPNHWGRGYATEVCRKLMETVRQETAIYRVSTFVDAENLASIKVLLKSGLVEEARLEKWYRFINQGMQPKDCILFRLPL